MKEIKNKKVYNENETHDKNMCIFILLKQYLHSQVGMKHTYLYQLLCHTVNMKHT